VSDWRRAAHKPRKEQKKVCRSAAPPFVSLVIGVSGPGNVEIQATRTPLSRVLNRGKT